jgi:luciferase family oxidoreductase group 1
MIRNHPPLVTAEQAVTLSLLYPARVDLGLGRSGGSDAKTDARIRRTVVDYVGFEEDVAETTYHLDQLGAVGVQVFVLASSSETAIFAGRQGLGLAVAGHVAPAGIHGAISAYRESFRSRAQRSNPWVVLCLPILVASSDQEASWWFGSVQQRYLDRLRSGGAPMRLPAEVNLDWSPSERYRVDAMLEAAIVGSDTTVRGRLLDVAQRWAPDEVMTMTDLPDAEITMNSHRRLADIAAALPTASQRDL